MAESIEPIVSTDEDGVPDQQTEVAQLQLLDSQVPMEENIAAITAEIDNLNEKLDEVSSMNHIPDLLPDVIQKELSDPIQSIESQTAEMAAPIVAPINVPDADSVITENIEVKKAEKKSNRKDSSRRGKKEHRNLDMIVKNIQTIKGPEEQLNALWKKYTELYDENHTLQSSLKTSERLSSQTKKEKEQLQTEHNKAILARSRLESLCRELQRQYKVVKDESILRIREEEEKRKEVSAKFQTTLGEISNLMQENSQKNSILREENKELAQKLKTLVDQYEIREQHIEKILKHKELETQLAEAKLAKLAITINEEKEAFLREKQKLLEDLNEYQKRCHELTANEVQLRSQLSLYTDKYQEFQETLTKSNQVFTSFRGEMEKMSKKIKKLEKETSSWKCRWESSSKALVEMAEDKQKRDLEYLTAQKKIVQLEKLCRALQTDRSSLQKQLKTITGYSEEICDSSDSPCFDCHNHDDHDHIEDHPTDDIPVVVANHVECCANENAVHLPLVVIPTDATNPPDGAAEDVQQQPEPDSTQVVEDAANSFENFSLDICQPPPSDSMEETNTTYPVTSTSNFSTTVDCT